MLLTIDNYDSLTYNLVQCSGELKAKIKVVRNDELSVGQIEALASERIIPSPGPCTPNEASISPVVIKHFAGKLPLSGVCPGHQSIGQAFDGEVMQAWQVVHDKVSSIHYKDLGMFIGLANPLTVVRHHSLVVKRENPPGCLEIVTWIQYADGSLNGIVGVRCKILNVKGVQFHPESILTEQGHELLASFLRQQGGMRGRGN